MSRYRLWLFRITAITFIPALFLISLEIALGILGFGYPTRFTVECEVNDRTAYCNNDKFSWLFFAPELARESLPFIIPADKPKGTYRIFVLGGSAAQGDPEHTFGMARILKVILNDQYPEINFEVINTAVTAINSHVVLQITKDLAHHQPDLFILYLGNNEVVGPFGAGTVFAPLSPSLSFIRSSILLKSTRLGQALAKFLRVGSKTEHLPKEWGGMEMFLEKQVRIDDPGMENVYNHFQKNLEDLLDVARKAGIMTIVSTVGTNLKNNGPFASLHRRDITEDEKKAWDNMYQTGIELELNGMYGEAIKAYLEAARIDTTFADLQYRLGRCYWAVGKYDAARQRYIWARDYDTLRFRADTRINNIIRKVANAKGVYLLDAAQIFEDESPYQTLGKELFHDHVHMNFRGNYVLAASVGRQFEELCPEWVRQAKEERGPLTKDQCAKRLALTWYDRYEITAEVIKRLQKPPFPNQLYHKERLERLQENRDALQAYTDPNHLEEAALQYRWAIQNDDSDPWLHHNYARLLQAKKDLEGAAKQLRLSLGYLSQSASSYTKLVKILILQGKFEEAIAECRKALQINPRVKSIHYDLAFALAKQGKFDQSIAAYEKNLDLDPSSSTDIYNQIGRILVNLDKLDEAATTFRKAVRFNDESDFKKDIPDVHFNLGYVLKKLGKLEESRRELARAVEGYRKELRANPNSSETHTVLGRALTENGDYKEATKNFHRAVDLDPANLSRHENLIKVLEVQGRLDEAIKSTQKAIAIMMNNNQQDAADKLRNYLHVLEYRRLQKKVKDDTSKFSMSKYLKMLQRAHSP
jgi:tetratricopeptide (TPR) repeat protein